MKKTVSVLLTLIISVLAFCSCGNPIEEHSGMSIVCTSFPQYDYIKNIIGSEEGLTLLLDDGGDLHSYEPSAQDIMSIGAADLFVYVGGVSDKWVENTLHAAENQKVRTVSLMDCVETYAEEYVAGMEHKHSGEHGTQDEHVWLSLKNAVKITQALCDIICEIDAENSQIYKANAEKYIAELTALDAEYTAVINSAKRNTLLFADRFPFRYLIEDYNLTYHAAFAGCSSESEASFQTMAFLIDKTNELALPVVLTIDGSDGSIAKSVCDATGAKSAMLDSCQSVTAKDIKNGTSYINIMKNNLEVLREVLN